MAAKHGGTLEPDGTRFVSSAHPNYHVGDELTGWCDWFYHYLGVIVTDEHGRPLSAPLAVEPDVTWVGYANVRIRAQVEPLLRQALAARGLV